MQPQRHIVVHKVLHAESLQGGAAFVAKENPDAPLPAGKLRFDANLKQAVLVEDGVVYEAQAPESVGVRL